VIHASAQKDYFEKKNMWIKGKEMTVPTHFSRVVLKI
jgi:hypothetical protein